MQCPECNATAPADSAFCPKCGHRFNEPGAKSAATPVDKMKQAAAANKNSEGNDAAESVLWHGSYSPLAMVGNWILAGLITVAALAAIVFTAFNPIVAFVALVLVAALWIGMVGYLYLQRWSVDYELTSQRFVHRQGLLSRTTNRVEVIDIDDVQVQQGFVERMLGVGTIKLLSSDTSDPVLSLKGIADVNRIATMIDNARREERRKRGLYVESV